MRRLGLALSLLATGGLVVLVARSDWRALLEPLRQAQLGWLLIALGLQLLVETAKALRWLLLLGLPLGALPELLGVLLASRLLNALAPLRAGDAWRVAFAARARQRPLLAAGGAVLVEKLLDGAGLGLLGLALLGRGDLDLPRLPDGGPAWLLGGALLLATLGLALAARGPVGRLLLGRDWRSGLAHLVRPTVLPGVLALSAVSLGLGGLVNLLVLRALGLALDPVAAGLMLLAGYAVGLLPSAPGQPGLFEAAVAAPLLARGFTLPTALAAALGLHAVQLAALATGGLLALALCRRELKAP